MDRKIKLLQIKLMNKKLIKNNYSFLKNKCIKKIFLKDINMKKIKFILLFLLLKNFNSILKTKIILKYKILLCLYLYY